MRIPLKIVPQEIIDDYNLTALVENLGGYHSKRHPPEHHIAVRSKYLHVLKLSSPQGCDNLTVRVKPTKQEIQKAQLQRYFLGFIH